MPTSYSRLTEIHESSNRLSNKDRSETNDSNLLSYSRSNKTDNDVTATLEKYGLKTDNYKIRNDTRFLNTSNLDSKYTVNRKYGGTTLESTRNYNNITSSSTTKPKTVLNSRLQRKDSLTKSDNTDSSPSPIRSVERKSSSSAIGGSSSPIEIRKSSEVWDKPLSVSYGEISTKGVFENDLFQKIDNKSHVKLASRENSEDLSESSIILENIENEEKSLSFAEIRKKFDNNDTNSLKNGFDNCSKSSQSVEPKASISNGVILGVYNFGQMQYLDRNSKCKKVVDSSVDETDSEIIEVEKIQTNNSFSSPQTLHGLILKPIPSNLKNNNNNCPVLNKKSPEPNSDTNFKKRSSPDLKKNLLNSPSPEKKETLLPLVKLPAIPMNDTDNDSEIKRSEEGTLKRDTRSSSISSKLGIESKNDVKVQSKQKGEKLLTKIEQTLAKPGDVDAEVMNTLSRIRRSPEAKPKDFENHTKVIELRRIEPLPSAANCENENKKIKEQDSKEKSKDKKSESPTSGNKEKSPQKNVIKPVEKVTKKSPEKEVIKSVDTLSPKDSGKEVSPVMKSKRTSSPKDEKESSNTRERDMNKKLIAEDRKEQKGTKKEEKYKVDATINLTKETPIWDKNEFTTNLNNRTFTGPSSSQCTNSQASNESLVSFGFFVA